MKFEKITDTKIKIILSLQDMESNNLSAENVLSNSADSQKLLDLIINKAETVTDYKVMFEDLVTLSIKKQERK